MDFNYYTYENIIVKVEQALSGNMYISYDHGNTWKLINEKWNIPAMRCMILGTKNKDLQTAIYESII